MIILCFSHTRPGPKYSGYSDTCHLHTTLNEDTKAEVSGGTVRSRTWTLVAWLLGPHLSPFTICPPIGSKPHYSFSLGGGNWSYLLWLLGRRLRKHLCKEYWRNVLVVESCPPPSLPDRITCAFTPTQYIYTFFLLHGSQLRLAPKSPKALIKYSSWGPFLDILNNHIWEQTLSIYFFFHF